MTRPVDPHQPNPGSPEAVEKGCTCPILDNGYGRGTPYRGEVEFWISGDCPLHAVPPKDGEDAN